MSFLASLRYQSQRGSAMRLTLLFWTLLATSHSFAGVVINAIYNCLFFQYAAKLGFPSHHRVPLKRLNGFWWRWNFSVANNTQQQKIVFLFWFIIKSSNSSKKPKWIISCHVVAMFCMSSHRFWCWLHGSFLWHHLVDSNSISPPPAFSC